jgi:ATP-binding cassette, subfamily C, bacterial EexD
VRQAKNEESQLVDSPKLEVDSIGDALAACRRSIRAMAAFSLVTNLLSLTPLFYMINVYDKAVATGSIPTLLALVGITAFLYLILGLMEWVRSMVLVHMASHLDKLLSQRFYEIVFATEALFGGSSGVGSQPLRDFNALRQFLSGPTAAAIFDLPWIPLFMLIMFFFHPTLAVVGFLCLATMAAVAILNQRGSTKAMQRATHASGLIANQTQKNLRNAEVATAMGMMAPLTSRWRLQQDDMVALQSQASSATSGYGAAMKVLGMAVQSIAITTGAVLAMAQEISPGVIIGAALLLGKTIQPVQAVVMQWRGVVEAYAQYGRLNDLLDAHPCEAPRVLLPPISGAVSATNATIVPPGADKPNLTNINLNIRPGTVTMVIGPSAAGKSSLVRAILGIWPTESGDIRMDGAEIDQYDSSDKGHQIGYLPQDIELFDGTIAENITRFGQIEPELLFQAARDAGVHEMVLDLPNGYDTVIGSGQGMLSPGQRQRIALARALYQRPKFLVLDEPNSNLDEAGEKALHHAIAVMKQSGSAVLLVSHRHGALELVDTLIIMENGTIAIQGPRDAVLSKLRELQSSQQAAPQAEQHAATDSAETAGEGGDNAR